MRANQAYSLRQWIAALLTSLNASSVEGSAPVAHVKILATLPTDSPLTITSDLPTSNSQVRYKASLTQLNPSVSEKTIVLDVAQGNPETNAHEFILNARINTTPAHLEQMTMQAIEHAKPAPNSRYYLEHFECFSPLPPPPHHRL